MVSESRLFMRKASYSWCTPTQHIPSSPEVNLADSEVILSFILLLTVYWDLKNQVVRSGVVSEKCSLRWRLLNKDPKEER